MPVGAAGPVHTAHQLARAVPTSPASGRPLQGGSDARRAPRRARPDRRASAPRGGCASSHARMTSRWAACWSSASPAAASRSAAYMPHGLEQAVAEGAVRLGHALHQRLRDERAEHVDADRRRRPAARRLSSEKLSGRTASRRSIACSSGPSRSWLQSSVAASVWWRETRRRPPVRSRKRSSRRSTSWRGGEVGGAGGGQLDGQRDAVEAPAELRRPRHESPSSTLDRRARFARPSPRTAAMASVSTASGATAYTCSPAMPSGSRLVASSLDRPPRASTASTTSATASRTCSQLSRMQRIGARREVPGDALGRGRRRGCRGPRSGDRGRRPPSSSEVAARSAKATPSGNWPATCEATARASRVLPDPPAPVRVTSAWSVSEGGDRAPTSCLTSDERGGWRREAAADADAVASKAGTSRAEPFGHTWCRCCDGKPLEVGARPGRSSAPGPPAPRWSRTGGPGPRGRRRRRGRHG